MLAIGAISLAVRISIFSQTASTWLHALAEARLLQAFKVGRDLVFVNHEFLNVLTRDD